MKKEPLIFIKHILQNIEDIEIFSKGLSKNNLEKDILRQKAIIRSLEIIGEAVRNLPDSFKKKHPETPWKDIIGTRDKMIHHYFGVDINTVWGIIKKDLPNLERKIEKIKKELKEDSNKQS